MARVKVDVKALNRLLKKMGKLKSAPKRSVATKIGREVVKGIKKATLSAKSPIEGVKFDPLDPKYARLKQFRTTSEGKAAKKSQSAKKRRAKRRAQGKGSTRSPAGRRPVPNLRLTGEFMKGLNFSVEGNNKKGYRTVVGYNEEQSKKERGHREGANGQAKRPTIPKGKERFIKPIQDKIVKAYEDAIKRIVRAKK